MNRMSTRTKVVALGAGAAVTLGGAGFVASSAYAATTPQPSATASAKPGTPSPGAKDAKRHHHKGHAFRLGRNIAHADITMQTKKGFVERRIQRGTITAMTASQLTVKSADGYLSTYALGAKHPEAAVKVGVEVRAIGTVKGSTATLNRVVTMAQLKQRAEQHKAAKEKAAQSKQGNGSASSSPTS